MNYRLFQCKCGARVAGVGFYAACIECETLYEYRGSNPRGRTPGFIETEDGWEHLKQCLKRKDLFDAAVDIGAGEEIQRRQQRPLRQRLQDAVRNR